MSKFQSEQNLFDAAIESARIFNGVAAECAATSGLFEAMREFTVIDTIMERMRFHPAKLQAFHALIDVLVHQGLAEKHESGQPVYRAKHAVIQEMHALDGGLRRHVPRLEVISPWYGEEHVELIRSSNREFLGSDLGFFRQPQMKIRFDHEDLATWRKNLLNPLYEFGRVLAVRELVRYGHRFLDLCCGPGFGAERLAQLATGGCEIIGIDRSSDFLEEARKLIYPGARVSFIQRDLNDGLPALPRRYFDGVLFNGAFHFMQDKPARLREVHDVLRPGGLLVIGHCFSRSGFDDEAMHDLYFSMIENQSWPMPWEGIRSMVADNGFQEFKTFHRGSHSYLLAVRLDIELPQPSAPRIFQ